MNELAPQTVYLVCVTRIRNEASRVKITWQGVRIKLAVMWDLVAYPAVSQPQVSSDTTSFVSLAKIQPDFLGHLSTALNYSAAQLSSLQQNGPDTYWLLIAVALAGIVLALFFSKVRSLRPEVLLRSECPYCQGPFEYGTEAAGQRIGCPHCSMEIILVGISRWQRIRPWFKAVLTSALNLGKSTTGKLLTSWQILMIQTKCVWTLILLKRAESLLGKAIVRNREGNPLSQGSAAKLYERVTECRAELKAMSRSVPWFLRQPVILLFLLPAVGMMISPRRTRLWFVDSTGTTAYATPVSSTDWPLSPENTTKDEPARTPEGTNQTAQMIRLEPRERSIRVTKPVASVTPRKVEGIRGVGVSADDVHNAVTMSALDCNVESKAPFSPTGLMIGGRRPLVEIIGPEEDLYQISTIFVLRGETRAEHDKMRELVGFATALHQELAPFVREQLRYALLEPRRSHVKMITHSEGELFYLFYQWRNGAAMVEFGIVSSEYHSEGQKRQARR